MVAPGRPGPKQRMRLLDFLRIGSHEGVSSHLHRDRTLGVFAQGQTGNSQHGRLFLNSTRVGEHQASRHCRVAGNPGSRGGRSAEGRSCQRCRLQTQFSQSFFACADGPER